MSKPLVDRIPFAKILIGLAIFLPFHWVCARWASH
jgi:hypothetical protein